MALYIQETYLNTTENSYIDETPVYEAFTDDRGRLFRELQREYGRCTGKVYIDTEDGETKAIGWVFEGLDAYSDSPTQKYMREVWVTIHERMPETVTTYHYA